VWNVINGSGLFLETAPGEKVTSFLSFGKVDTDTVTVMVPMAGFTTVSVLDANDAKKAKIDLSIAQAALKQSSHTVPKLADPVAIERYTRALDDSTSTHAGGKDITVTLASDVTFASDSADLTPQADAQLQTVAGKLSQYPDGGTLTIVGHTDDIQDDAYNQTLSEKRANAVHTRLTQLTNLDKWQTSITGKGESEPRVKDTTDEARATNRRVEITLTPANGTTIKSSNPSTATSATASSSGKLPDPQGPVAKGSEGVTLTAKGTDASGEVAITLDHVTRKGGYLLGQVQTTTRATKDSIHNFDQWLEDKEMYHLNSRGEDASAGITEFAADGLTLLAGNERIYPADYLPPVIDRHRPPTEQTLTSTLKEGATTTVCVVWPDTGQDTVTLDHPGHKNNLSYVFRLTDIPVITA